MAEKKGFWTEFKEFISRGSVMDMAVGVVVGGAFTSIVTALVDSIINPLITLISGNADFSDVVVGIFPVGQLISAVINFLLISFVVFLMVRSINEFKDASEKKLQELAKKKASGEEIGEEEEESAPITETSLLLEIRDLLKAQAESQKSEK
ncbi:MAG: large conductance mechanosensitive channel protein MscL [Clostridia bacterium]|nr:large conductance mechanosensitive channel protein MscL [Clostridia bacterium]